MRAIVTEKFGGPDVLVEREVPDPSPGPDEIAIAVEAAGVNFGEIMMRKGHHPLALQNTILGNDAAGVVSAVGPEVEGFSIGDRVAASLLGRDGSIRGGGYAATAIADPSRTVRLPDGVDAAEALGLIIPGVTAWFLLHQIPEIQGRTVLIHAAAGGTGSQAVQLAHILGAARVFGTASNKDKRALVRELGAESIDYGQNDWPTRVRELTGGRGVDAVFDSVAGETAAGSVAALAMGGKVVLYGSNSGSPPVFTPETWRAIGIGLLSIQGFTNLYNLKRPELIREVMLKLMDFYVAGRLRVELSRFALADAAGAHRALQARQTRGKIVLVP
ncbi:MAG: zinc-binding dehydrogenase [Desulfatitalea sp.]|nr:zinc-binding dehydrogenase [Desulfatitalea sp.]NNJ99143.1 zinc-binding dehydrogenase [Desulfatitalea sp.]